MWFKASYFVSYGGTVFSFLINHYDVLYEISLNFNWLKNKGGVYVTHCVMNGILKPIIDYTELCYPFGILYNAQL